MARCLKNPWTGVQIGQSHLKGAFFASAFYVPPGPAVGQFWKQEVCAMPKTAAEVDEDFDNFGTILATVQR